MGDSLKCQICGKPATVHLTQILNNQIQKLDLCESCAKAHGITDTEGFSLAELLSKSGSGLVTDEAASSLKCPHCGFTPADFKRMGRLGCPECYDEFQDLLTPMLKNMQDGLKHQGKVPEGLLTRVSQKKKLKHLESLLKQSIAEERYEDAAKYRDELKSLRQS